MAEKTQEEQDAEFVNDAIECIVRGELARAETMLRGVVARAPATYSRVEPQPDGALAVKFWSEGEFVRHALWQSQQPQPQSIVWLPSAYPPAFYYLGFLCVKTQRYQEALQWLERGEQLEPTHPLFALEKAQAYVRLGNHARALELYDSLQGPNHFVSEHEVAVARRGRGFVLIEMNQLDAAEQAFRESLQLEPDSEIAHGELEYIRRLREGGARAPIQSTPTTPDDHRHCARCGQEFTEGTIVPFEGRAVVICKRCQRKLTKQWWEFWK